MATQDAIAFHTQDVHEVVLRGVEEEGSEGDEEGLRGLRLVSCIARKDKDLGRFRT